MSSAHATPAARGAEPPRRLAAAAEAAGARLIILHPPRREDLQLILRGGSPWYGEWFSEIGEIHGVVRPESGFGSIGDDSFESGGHYSPRLNGAVARVLLGRL